MSAPPASVTPVHGSGIAFRLRHSSRFGMAALRRLRPFDASGPDFTGEPLTAWRQRSRLNPREAHRKAVRAVRRGPVIDAVVRQGIAKERVSVHKNDR